MLPKSVDWSDVAAKTPLPFSLHLTGRHTPPTGEVVQSETYVKLLGARIKEMKTGLSPVIDFICAFTAPWSVG